MTEPCKYEELIRDTNSDIKVLISKFDNHAKELLDLRSGFEGHKKESIKYRRQVDMLWAGVHFTKYAVMLIFGTGVLLKIIEIFLKK